MNNYKGIAYALLSSTAFGIMPILARIAYFNGSNPTTVLLFRFLISTLILFLYLNFSHININLKRGQVLLLISIGITGYTITTQALFISYNYLGGGLATTLHFIYPVVVCIAGFIFYKDKMSTKKIISLLLAAAGIYTLVGFKNNTINILGICLALFSGFSYGLTLIALNLKSIRSLDNRVTTMYLCLGSTIGTALCGLFNKSIDLNFNIKIVVCYLGISVVSTILSIILLLKAIELIGVSSSSILGTFEPIVSVFLGVLFLNEQMSFAILVGSSLILICTIVLAKDKCVSSN
ncbi:DMT family transporter [Clostridium ljungdahlii]|uniref:Threonine and homoserine efflux system n=1 Tax=Clostridium ljungdahlii TaxID=1538 RepID=A0A168RAI1_9CLOT|nr:DMT family transporter [Clostridium ljungdahlii]OAA90447.1 threonine and homoserine efflux system [Clostridium ljungdahlii]